MKRTQISADLPPSVARRLHQLAVQTDLAQRDVLEQLIMGAKVTTRTMRVKTLVV